MTEWLVVGLVAALQPTSGTTGTDLDGWAAPVAVEPDSAPSAVQLNSIGELTKNETMNEELHGAREPENMSDWLATFYSSFGSNPNAPKSCTSALVGARVVLTAAHCIKDGGSIAFSVQGKAYSGTCRRHAEFDKIPRNISTDYALCLVDRGVSGVRFETLAMEANPAPVGTPIRLTGFGCTDQSGANDGVFRTGPAAVKGGPFPPSDNHLRAEGEAVVCFGDSGGPAFVESAGRRRVISVNSIVAGSVGANRSYLAATFTPAARDFIKSWQTEMKTVDPTADTRICGVDSQAGGCR